MPKKKKKNGGSQKKKFDDPDIDEGESSQERPPSAKKVEAASSTSHIEDETDEVSPFTSVSIGGSSDGRGGSTGSFSHFWCNYCDYSADSKGDLVAHMRQHKIKCPYCPFNSLSRAEVARHCKSEHSKDLEEVSKEVPSTDLSEMDKDPCSACVFCDFMTYSTGHLEHHTAQCHPGLLAKSVAKMISKQASAEIRQADALFYLSGSKTQLEPQSSPLLEIDVDADEKKEKALLLQRLKKEMPQTISPDASTPTKSSGWNVKVETMYCMTCPYSNVSASKLRCHTISQHPLGATVATFNSSGSGSDPQDLTFFCVKESCNHTSSELSQIEEHLMNCCPTMEALPVMGQERLKSTLAFIKECHRKNKLEMAAGFSDYQFSILGNFTPASATNISKAPLNTIEKVEDNERIQTPSQPAAPSPDMQPSPGGDMARNASPQVSSNMNNKMDHANTNNCQNNNTSAHTDVNFQGASFPPQTTTSSVLNPSHGTVTPPNQIQSAVNESQQGYYQATPLGMFQPDSVPQTFQQQQGNFQQQPQQFNQQLSQSVNQMPDNNLLNQPPGGASVQMDNAFPQPSPNQLQNASYMAPNPGQSSIPPPSLQNSFVGNTSQPPANFPNSQTNNVDNGNFDNSLNQQSQQQPPKMMDLLSGSYNILLDEEVCQQPPPAQSSSPMTSQCVTQPPFTQHGAMDSGINSVSEYAPPMDGNNPMVVSNNTIGFQQGHSSLDTSVPGNEVSATPQQPYTSTNSFQFSTMQSSQTNFYSSSNPQQILQPAVSENTPLHPSVTSHHQPYSQTAPLAGGDSSTMPNFLVTAASTHSTVPADTSVSQTGSANSFLNPASSTSLMPPTHTNHLPEGGTTNQPAGPMPLSPSIYLNNKAMRPPSWPEIDARTQGSGLHHSHGERLRSPGQMNPRMPTPGQMNARKSVPGQMNARMASPGQINARLASPGQMNARMVSPGQMNPRMPSQGQNLRLPAPNARMQGPFSGNVRQRLQYPSAPVRSRAARGSHGGMIRPPMAKAFDDDDVIVTAVTRPVSQRGRGRGSIGRARGGRQGPVSQRAVRPPGPSRAIDVSKHFEDIACLASGREGNDDDDELAIVGVTPGKGKGNPMAVNVSNFSFCCVHCGEDQGSKEVMKKHMKSRHNDSILGAFRNRQDNRLLFFCPQLTCEFMTYDEGRLTDHLYRCYEIPDRMKSLPFDLPYALKNLKALKITHIELPSAAGRSQDNPIDLDGQGLRDNLGCNITDAFDHMVENPSGRTVVRPPQPRVVAQPRQPKPRQAGPPGSATRGSYQFLPGGRRGGMQQQRAPPPQQLAGQPMRGVRAPRARGRGRPPLTQMQSHLQRPPLGPTYQMGPRGPYPGVQQFPQRAPQRFPPGPQPGLPSGNENSPIVIDLDADSPPEPNSQATMSEQLHLPPSSMAPHPMYTSPGVVPNSATASMSQQFGQHLAPGQSNHSQTGMMSRPHHPGSIGPFSTYTSTNPMQYPGAPPPHQIPTTGPHQLDNDVTGLRALALLASGTPATTASTIEQLLAAPIETSSSSFHQQPGAHFLNPQNQAPISHPQVTPTMSPQLQDSSRRASISSNPERPDSIPQSESAPICHAPNSELNLHSAQTLGSNANNQSLEQNPIHEDQNQTAAENRQNPLSSSPCSELLPTNKEQTQSNEPTSDPNVGQNLQSPHELSQTPDPSSEQHSPASQGTTNESTTSEQNSNSHKLESQAKAPIQSSHVPPMDHPELDEEEEQVNIILLEKVFAKVPNMPKHLSRRLVQKFKQYAASRGVRITPDSKVIDEFVSKIYYKGSGGNANQEVAGASAASKSQDTAATKQPATTDSVNAAPVPEDAHDARLPTADSAKRDSVSSAGLSQSSENSNSGPRPVVEQETAGAERDMDTDAGQPETNKASDDESDVVATQVILAKRNVIFTGAFAKMINKARSQNQESQGTKRKATDDDTKRDSPQSKKRRKSLEESKSSEKNLIGAEVENERSIPGSSCPVESKGNSDKSAGVGGPASDGYSNKGPGPYTHGKNSAENSPPAKEKTSAMSDEVMPKPSGPVPNKNPDKPSESLVGQTHETLVSMPQASTPRPNGSLDGPRKNVDSQSQETNVSMLQTSSPGHNHTHSLDGMGENLDSQNHRTSVSMPHTSSPGPNDSQDSQIHGTNVSVPSSHALIHSHDGPSDNLNGQNSVSVLQISNPGPTNTFESDGPNDHLDSQTHKTNISMDTSSPLSNIPMYSSQQKDESKSQQLSPTDKNSDSLHEEMDLGDSPDFHPHSGHPETGNDELANRISSEQVPNFLNVHSETENCHSPVNQPSLNMKMSLTNQENSPSSAPNRDDSGQSVDGRKTSPQAAEDILESGPSQETEKFNQQEQMSRTSPITDVQQISLASHSHRQNSHDHMPQPEMEEHSEMKEFSAADVQKSDPSPCGQNYNEPLPELHESNSCEKMQESEAAKDTHESSSPANGKSVQHAEDQPMSAHDSEMSESDQPQEPNKTTESIGNTQDSETKSLSEGTERRPSPSTELPANCDKRAESQTLRILKSRSPTLELPSTNISSSLPVVSHSSSSFLQSRVTMGSESSMQMSSLNEMNDQNSPGESDDTLRENNLVASMLSSEIGQNFGSQSREGSVMTMHSVSKVRQTKAPFIAKDILEDRLATNIYHTNHEVEAVSEQKEFSKESSPSTKLVSPLIEDEKTATNTHQKTVGRCTEKTSVEKMAVDGEEEENKEEKQSQGKRRQSATFFDKATGKLTLKVSKSGHGRKLFSVQTEVRQSPTEELKDVKTEDSAVSEKADSPTEANNADESVDDNHLHDTFVRRSVRKRKPNSTYTENENNDPLAEFMSDDDNEYNVNEDSDNYDDDSGNEGKKDSSDLILGKKARRVRHPPDPTAFNSSTKGKFQCWKCKKVLVKSGFGKRHIHIKHKAGLCVIYLEEMKKEADDTSKEEDDTSSTKMEPKLLVYCPRDCRYVTSDPEGLTKHQASCERPLLKILGEEMVKAQEDFMLNDYPKLSEILNQNGLDGLLKEISTKKTSEKKSTHRRQSFIKTQGGALVGPFLDEDGADPPKEVKEQTDVAPVTLVNNSTHPIAGLSQQNTSLGASLNPREEIVEDKIPDLDVTASQPVYNGGNAGKFKNTDVSGDSQSDSEVFQNNQQSVQNSAFHNEGQFGGRPTANNNSVDSARQPSVYIDLDVDQRLNMGPVQQSDWGPPDHNTQAFNRHSPQAPVSNHAPQHFAPGSNIAQNPPPRPSNPTFMSNQPAPRMGFRQNNPRPGNFQQGPRSNANLHQGNMRPNFGPSYQNQQQRPNLSQRPPRPKFNPSNPQNFRQRMPPPRQQNFMGPNYRGPMNNRPNFSPNRHPRPSGGNIRHPSPSNWKQPQQQRPPNFDNRAMYPNNQYANSMGGGQYTSYPEDEGDYRVEDNGTICLE